MKKILFLFILLVITTSEAKNIVPVPKPDITIGKDGEIIFNETKKNYVTQSKNKSNNQVKKFVTTSIDKKDEKEIKEEKKETTNKEEKKELLSKQEEKNREIKTNNEKEEKQVKKFITTSIDKKDEKEIKEESKELISKNNQKESKKITITNDNFVTKKDDINKLTNEKNTDKVPSTTQTLDRVVKSTNYNTSSKNLDIISKIEQNLTYSIKPKINRSLDIKKGSWSREELQESVVKKDFKITKTSKKIDDFDVEKTERDNKIANLKDQAYQAIKLKEYEIAIKLYKEALKLNKNDNFTKLSLATTYHVLGQYEQAKPIYMELLPVFPNSEQLISNLLSIIIQESPYEAIYLLPALADKYNSSAVIQAQTSVAFSTVERYKEAIEYIRKAISLNENNVEYKYNLAVLYDITKDYNKAYSAYKEVYNYIKNNQNYSISPKVIEDRIKTLNKLI